MGPEHKLLEINNLKKYFPVREGLLKRTTGQVKAVDDVSLVINRGETLGVVGESGCGKTTAGRSILRLLEPTSGEILFHSQKMAANNGGKAAQDVVRAGKRELKELRREMQIIFQDPFSSLNPRMTVGSIVGEPLRVYGMKSASERNDRVQRILSAVGLKPDHMTRHPHEFSGGQRQRIGIARALALEPQLIIADEPISALDVSIQAQVINLMQDLQIQFGLTYLFIAHDLSVVKYISDRVAVMYLGKIVELASSAEIFMNPQHPYTEALMSAVPVPDPDFCVQRILLEGDVPSPINPPSGCYFHPRCRYAENVCRNETPVYREMGPDHFVSCHLADKLSLRQVSC
ncbi:MAG: dipeptide ABC transporter ATP-binding protein [Desulfarculaceae bacterium]